MLLLIFAVYSSFEIFWRKSFTEKYPIKNVNSTINIVKRNSVHYKTVYSPDTFRSSFVSLFLEMFTLFKSEADSPTHQKNTLFTDTLLVFQHRARKEKMRNYFSYLISV